MKRFVMILLLGAAFFLDGAPLLSAHLRDSTLAARRARIRESENFKARQLVGTGLIFTAGAVGVDWAFYDHNINTPLKNFGDGLRERWGKIGVDDYLQYAPFAAYMALGALDRGDHRFIEHFAAGATAYATMGILVNALKYTVADLRPDGSTRNSFPSGHSATAFMGAELVMIEYGGWWGIGAYAAATTVALLRIYNGRHWFNDLLGGAAIGVFSAHVGYWLLPLERRWFGIKSRTELALVPFLTPPYSPSPSASFGLSLACTF